MLPGSALNQLIRVTDIMTIRLLVDGYRPSMAAIVLTLIANTVKIRVVPGGYQGMGHDGVLKKIIRIHLPLSRA